MISYDILASSIFNSSCKVCLINFSLCIKSPFIYFKSGRFSTIHCFSACEQSINRFSNFSIWYKRSSNILSTYIHSISTFIGLLDKSMALRFLRVSKGGINVNLFPWNEISDKFLNFTSSGIIWVMSLRFLAITWSTWTKG